MTAVNIELDIKTLSRILDKAVARLSRPKLMFAEMGEELLAIHFARFTAQQAPDGTPWTPLKDWYRESKKKNADKILTLDGHLSGTLRYQASDTGVVFGSDRPYAAIHQFGGTVTAKNAKALNVQGRPVKSVTIPARPWLGLSADDEQRLLEIARKHLKNEFNA
ncbi:phage virion morphogenesis protein [Rodentibacter sp. Ppn85]|uniref:phage virion morphogenesis protein n=1 Tax=Rodentibacter sp. Ppn85 TaxID=1908525 RepID=UPI000986FC68|nr:phage virion morphogenesis protein [Rodentibacter sp. Ppn85]OOF65135.1 phage virion morphogenesis protein [Rodentibacter sp. Ppn85]